MLRRMGWVFYFVAVALPIINFIDTAVIASDTWMITAMLATLGFIFAGNPFSRD